MESEPRVKPQEIYIRVVFIGAIFTSVSSMMFLIIWLYIQSINFRSGIPLLDLGVSIVLTVVITRLVTGYVSDWTDGVMEEVLSPSRMVAESKLFFTVLLAVSFVLLMIYFAVRLSIGGSLMFLVQNRPLFDLDLLLRYFIEFPLMGLATMLVGSMMLLGVLAQNIIRDDSDSVKNMFSNRTGGRKGELK